MNQFDNHWYNGRQQDPVYAHRLEAANLFKRRQRIKNWQHAGLIILAIPLLVIASVAGLFFLPAFWGLRCLAEIEYGG